WSQVNKEQYLSAMERSPVNDLEIKTVLAKVLTSDINNLELFMKGLDHSYYFEGYQLFKSEDL
ncbi:MAG: cell filamentation protein Fic, partial [Veillonella sp.]